MKRRDILTFGSLMISVPSFAAVDPTPSLGKMPEHEQFHYEMVSSARAGAVRCMLRREGNEITTTAYGRVQTVVTESADGSVAVEKKPASFVATKIAFEGTVFGLSHGESKEGVTLDVGATTGNPLSAERPIFVEVEKDGWQTKYFYTVPGRLERVATVKVYGPLSRLPLLVEIQRISNETNEILGGIILKRVN
jgi:hypothetical protein